MGSILNFKAMVWLLYAINMLHGHIYMSLFCDYEDLCMARSRNTSSAMRMTISCQD